MFYSSQPMTKMRLPTNIFKPVDASLYYFFDHSVHPNGRVELLVTVGSHPAQATVLTNFLVVDTLGVYNAIIRKVTLNAFRTVAFMYHLALKLPTLVGVEVVQGNLVEA